MTEPDPGKFRHQQEAGADRSRYEAQAESSQHALLGSDRVNHFGTLNHATELQMEAVSPSAGRFAFATKVGAVYQIGPQKRPAPPVGPPVLNRQPGHAVSELPCAASFAMEASRTNFCFPSPRNRQDIEGAGKSPPTTPPTTLWDLGSQYCRVVSNQPVTTVSEAGVLISQAGRARLAPVELIGCSAFGPDSRSVPDRGWSARSGLLKANLGIIRGCQRNLCPIMWFIESCRREGQGPRWRKSRFRDSCGE
jgi:hypothetical protein